MHESSYTYMSYISWCMLHWKNIRIYNEYTTSKVNKYIYIYQCEQRTKLSKEQENNMPKTILTGHMHTFQVCKQR